MPGVVSLFMYLIQYNTILIIKYLNTTQVPLVHQIYDN